jgi:hypothetical protein
MGAEHHAALCVDREGLALLLRVSGRTIRRLDDAGKLPRALMFGACKRWPVEEIQRWLREGAPARKQWDAMQGAGE